MTTQNTDINGLINTISSFIANLDHEDLLRDYSEDFPEDFFETMDQYESLEVRGEEGELVGVVTLTGDVLVQFKELASSFYEVLEKKEPLTQLISVRRILNQAVVNHVRVKIEGGDAESAVRDVLKSASKEKWIWFDVLVPISGIVLQENESITFQGATFEALTAERSTEIYGDVKRRAGPSWPTTTGRIFAIRKEFSFDADTARAIGRDSVSATIASMNFLSGLEHWIGDHSSQVKIHEGHSTVREIVPISVRNSVSGDWDHHYSIFNNYGFRYYQARERPSYYGLFDVVAALSSDSKGMALRVYNATIWCGRAMWESDRTLSFLYFISALEALLPLSDGEKTEAISLGVASIWKSRKKHHVQWAYDTMRAVYKVRSSILHGRSLVASERQRHAARKLAVNSIFNVALSVSTPPLMTLSDDAFKNHIRGQILFGSTTRGDGD